MGSAEQARARKNGNGTSGWGPSFEMSDLGSGMESRSEEGGSVSLASFPVWGESVMVKQEKVKVRVGSTEKKTGVKGVKKKVKFTDGGGMGLDCTTFQVHRSPTTLSVDRNTPAPTL